MTDVKVRGYGPPNAKIMAVGESPGSHEVAERQPFIGPAGRQLRDMMLQAGINPQDVYFTNICKYRPPGDKIASWYDHGLPAHPHAVSGLVELKDEIQRINPNVIIALGAFPAALLGQYEGCSLKWGTQKTDKGSINTFLGIGDWRGSILDGSAFAPGKKVIATYHPSYIIRGGYAEASLVVLDLERARAQSAYPDIRRPAPELIIDPQGADREDVKRRLLESSAPITFDIEYSRRTHRLYCVGFTTDSSWAATIPIRTGADLQFVREILLSGRPLCAQNSMFDCSILEHWHHIPCLQYLVHDTMIAAHAAYIEWPKDLGFLCRQYTEQPNYWSKFDGAYWNAVERDPSLISEHFVYNARDTWVTAAIRELQVIEEFPDQAVKWAFDHEMKLVQALWKVSKRGVRVDVDGIDKLALQLEAEADKYNSLLKSINNHHPLNVKSGPQVAKFLLELGCELDKKTAAGAYKTDDQTLADLMLETTDQFVLGALKAIRKVRECRDLKSKFCEIVVDPDGRMRCIYDPAKTTTGRLSSKKYYPTGSGTNLQNQPRDKRIRSKFIPDEGYELGYADLERAESLVVAMITKDPEMLRVHAAGIDAHLATASIIFEEPYEELLKAYSIEDHNDPIYITAYNKRYLGKQTGHSGNYMRGWKRLMMLVNAAAQETGISITAAEAKRFTDLYRASRPGLTHWWKDTEYELYKTRTLYNLLGRKRVFYDRIASILPEAIAYVPQSTVADALNIGLLACDADEELRILGFEMLMQVHDAIVYQYPIQYRFAVNSLVRQRLKVPLYLDPFHEESFTIPIEIQIGPNWGGGLKVWEDDLIREAVL